MSNVASISRVFINCTLGNKQLVKVKDSKWGDDSKVETVNAQGVTDGAAGFKESPGGCPIDFTVYGETGTEEIDYWALKQSKEEFALTRQIVGGRRLLYRPCRVSDISDADDDAGSVMRTVKIVCLKQPVFLS
jgi:hypothetical protein